MKQPPRDLWLQAGALVLLSVGIGALLFQASAGHVLLAGALTLATVALGWWATGRQGLAVLAGAVAALWPLVHAASSLVLAIGVAIAILTPLWPQHRILAALVALAAGGAGGFLVGGSPVAAGLSASIALGAGLTRPTSPSEGTTGALRLAALLAPALLLATALAVNAGTGALETASVRGDLSRGLGLFALVSLGALSLLGVATLLESREAWQAGIWWSLALCAGLVAASALRRDPSLVLEALSVAAAPIGLTAALATLRLRWVLGTWALALAPVAVVLQWGLV